MPLYICVEWSHTGMLYTYLNSSMQLVVHMLEQQNFCQKPQSISVSLGSFNDPTLCVKINQIVNSA